MKRMRAMAAQSPALVISVAALFFSLGSGAGYAATLSSHPAATAQSAQVVAAHAVAPRTATTWHALSLMNGWKGNSYDSGVPAYGVNGSGILYLRGSLYNSSTNTSEEFAVLPPGNRPSHYLWLPIYTNAGTEGSLAIAPNGVMEVFNGGSSDSASRLYSSIAGVTFPIGT